MVSSVEGMKVLLLDEETTQIVSTVYSQVSALCWVGLCCRRCWWCGTHRGGKTSGRAIEPIENPITYHYYPLTR
jgi:hypothetical protein